MAKSFRLMPLVALLLFAGSVFAQEAPEWTKPFPPYRIMGNIYYVGSQGLASYLITTPQGNILINSSLEKSVPLIRQSVEQLGFRFSDTKILLISHAPLGPLRWQRGRKGTDWSQVHGYGCRRA